MPKKIKATFPVSRIKRIMQSDDEVGKIASATPVLISKCLELFLEDLITDLGNLTDGHGSRTASPGHLRETILKEEKYDFLKDLVADIPPPPPPSTMIRAVNSPRPGTNEGGQGRGTGTGTGTGKGKGKGKGRGKGKGKGRGKGKGKGKVKGKGKLDPGPGVAVSEKDPSSGFGGAPTLAQAVPSARGTQSATVAQPSPTIDGRHATSTLFPSIQTASVSSAKQEAPPKPELEDAAAQTLPPGSTQAAPRAGLGLGPRLDPTTTGATPLLSALPAQFKSPALGSFTSPMLSAATGHLDDEEDYDA